MKRLAAVVVLAFVVAGCTHERKASTAAAKQKRIEELSSPAGADAGEPFLYGTLDGVLLSWLEPVAGGDHVALRVARYSGGQWSTPRTVVERNDLVVNWADFPSVIEDAQGVLFAHWPQKSAGGTYASDVRMSTSADGGVTWREPFLLNRDGKAREHGFATLAALPKGGVGATWLDGRNMESGGHDEEDSGEMSVRYATVDANGTVAADVELDGRTCECCTTGMAVSASGPLVVYRDRLPEEIRDISFVKLERNAWTKPRTLHGDGWKIAGCPVNGPQVDALGHRVAAAWFTAPGEQGRVLVAFSADGGTTFGTPVRVDEGKPIGRLDVVLADDDTALVSWLEQTPAGGEIRVRRVRRGGGAEPSMKIADSTTSRAAGFVRMARSGHDVYVTWTDQDDTGKRIHIARTSGASATRSR
jgi:hypothetical protein